METHGFEHRRLDARDHFLLNAVLGLVPAELAVTGALPSGQQRFEVTRSTLLFRTELEHFHRDRLGDEVCAILEDQFGVKVQVHDNPKGAFLEFAIEISASAPDEIVVMFLGAIQETIRHAARHPEMLNPSARFASAPLWRQRMQEPFATILERDEPELFAAVMIKGRTGAAELPGKILAMCPVPPTHTLDQTTLQQARDAGLDVKLMPDSERPILEIRANFTEGHRVEAIIATIAFLRQVVGKS